MNDEIKLIRAIVSIHCELERRNGDFNKRGMGDRKRIKNILKLGKLQGELSTLIRRFADRATASVEVSNDSYSA